MAGIKFICQQIKSLIIKRYQIFYRRFILAAFILLGPFIFEAVFMSLIPSNTNLVQFLFNKIKLENSRSLSSTLLEYGKQTLPYQLQDNSTSYLIEPILRNHYVNNTSIQLKEILPITSQDLNDYVYQLRQKSQNHFLYDYFLGLNFKLNSSTNRLDSIGYYSTLAFHSSAVILNEINNILLKYYTKNMSLSINTINQPISINILLNSTDFFKDLPCLDILPNSLLDLTNAIVIAFLISIYVCNIAKERINGSKKMQLLTGVHYLVYWLSNYIFDLIIIFINISSIVFIFKMIDLAKNDITNEINAVASNNSTGYFFVVLLFSSFSCIALAYFWSFFFK